MVNKIFQTADQVIEEIKVQLAHLDPYEYSKSRNNSAYVQFRAHPKLRSLRISDHAGKYKFTWNIGFGMGTFVQIDQIGKGKKFNRYYFNEADLHEFYREINMRYESLLGID